MKKQPDLLPLDEDDEFAGLEAPIDFDWASIKNPVTSAADFEAQYLNHWPEED